MNAGKPAKRQLKVAQYRRRLVQLGSGGRWKSKQTEVNEFKTFLGSRKVGIGDRSDVGNTKK